MAVGDRIEGAGIDPDPLAHASPPVAGVVPLRPSASSASPLPSSSPYRQPRHRNDALAVADLEHARRPGCRGARCGCRRPGTRITMPPSVTSMIWSLCPTGKTATTASWRAAQLHVVDALPAAPGDAVIVGRAAHAEAFFGHARARIPRAAARSANCSSRDRVAAGLASSLVVRRGCRSAASSASRRAGARRARR